MIDCLMTGWQTRKIKQYENDHHKIKGVDMQNDYSNKQGQDAADKTSDFVKSAGQKIEEKGKHIGGDTSKMFKEGKEEVGRVIETVDRQVHDRPWLMIACVAVGSFLIGGLFSRSK